jgi:hypothetical protein
MSLYIALALSSILARVFADSTDYTQYVLPLYVGYVRALIEN